MQLSSLLTAAGLAASASHAFLLPFADEFTDKDTITTLPVPIETEENVKIPVTAETRHVDLDCPGCPVPLRRHHKGRPDDGPRVATEIPSHLELDFAIDHASQSDRLLVNGFELYPKRDPASMMHDVLSAKLVPEFRHHRQGRKRPEHKNRKHKNKKHHERPPQPLGYGVRIQPIAQSTEDNMELILVDLQIIEVGNVFVDGIPDVEVKLIKTAAGGLMIGGIDVKPTKMSNGSTGETGECSTFLCRWRAMVMEQFARIRNGKPCNGRLGSHANRPDGHIEGIHRHPHHHMHHGHRASWGQLFKNIGSHILLPIAVGILAGVAASVLGMMVGTAVVCLWRTFFRRGSRRCHRRRSCHKAAKKETAVAEEKTGLMANEEDIDAPPAYADEQAAEEDKTSRNEA